MRTPTGGSIVGFVTNDAQNVEGWHKKDDVDGPLLYIVNEAKGFKEDKFERIDRCGFNALMYISSPGAKMGRFYDSHAGLSAQFHTIMAGYTDCPHIPKEKHDDLIAMYGINHPVVRSTLYGEFMSQDEMDRYVCDVDTSGVTFALPAALHLLAQQVLAVLAREISDAGAAHALPMVPTALTRRTAMDPSPALIAAWASRACWRVW